MRILPRLNEAVNEEWISDKARQIVDGLEDASASTGLLCARTASCSPASWPGPSPAIAAKVKATAPEKIGFIGGDLSCGRRPLSPPSRWPTALGSKNIDARQDGAKLDPALGRASSYLFNPTVEGDRPRRRPADHRRQPALGSAGAERPHPPALAGRQFPDRR